MVSLEGIPSLFPAQPRMRPPKPRIYESLFLWNEGIDQLLTTLRGLERFPFADKRSLRCTQAEIEEIRAGVNADFVEAISEHERRNHGRFWKLRRSYEKTLEDPDDVYFEVEEREEQRRKQGLSPRLGIVSPSAIAAEQGRIETEARRNKKRSTKHRKPKVSTMRGGSSAAATNRRWRLKIRQGDPGSYHKGAQSTLHRVRD
jgi:hypothetical protein